MMPLSQAVCDRIRRLCELHTQADVAAIVGVAQCTVSNIKARGFKAGRVGPQPKPLPGDYRIQCQDMKITELMAHYGVSQQTVAKWNAIVGRKRLPRADSGHRYKPMPVPSREALAAAISQHGIAGAAREFGVHQNTLLKWRRLHDLPFSLTKGPRSARAARAAQPRTFWVDRFRDPTSEQRNA